jgi:serine/threonine protein kinase
MLSPEEVTLLRPLFPPPTTADNSHHHHRKACSSSELWSARLWAGSTGAADAVVEAVDVERALALAVVSALPPGGARAAVAARAKPLMLDAAARACAAALHALAGARRSQAYVGLVMLPPPEDGSGQRLAVVMRRYGGGEGEGNDGRCRSLAERLWPPSSSSSRPLTAAQVARLGAGLAGALDELGGWFCHGEVTPDNCLFVGRGAEEEGSDEEHDDDVLLGAPLALPHIVAAAAEAAVAVVAAPQDAPSASAAFALLEDSRALLRAAALRRGLPGFMAPEQFGAGGSALLGPPADVWGLACTVLAAATGAAPWSPLPQQQQEEEQEEEEDQAAEQRTTPSLAQLAQAVGAERRAPPLPSWLPADLRAVLAACLDAQPERRPTPAQARRALLQCAAAAEAEAAMAMARASTPSKKGVPGPQAPPPPPLPPSFRRYLLLESDGLGSSNSMCSGGGSGGLAGASTGGGSSSGGGGGRLLLAAAAATAKEEEEEKSTMYPAVALAEAPSWADELPLPPPPQPVAVVVATATVAADEEQAATTAAAPAAPCASSSSPSRGALSDRLRGGLRSLFGAGGSSSSGGVVTAEAVFGRRSAGGAVAVAAASSSAATAEHHQEQQQQQPLEATSELVATSSAHHHNPPPTMAAATAAVEAQAARLASRSRLLARRGDAAGADACAREAWLLLRSALGPAHPLTCNAACTLAARLVAAAPGGGAPSLTEAAALYSQAFSHRLSALGPAHPETTLCAHNLGVCLARAAAAEEEGNEGQSTRLLLLEKALAAHGQALEGRRATASAKAAAAGGGGAAASSATAAAARSQRHVAHCLVRLGRDPEAEPHLRRALHEARSAAGDALLAGGGDVAAAPAGTAAAAPPPPQLCLSRAAGKALLAAAVAAEELAACLRRQGRVHEAEPLLREAAEARGDAEMAAAAAVEEEAGGEEDGGAVAVAAAPAGSDGSDGATALEHLLAAEQRLEREEDDAAVAELRRQVESVL